MKFKSASKLGLAQLRIRRLLIITGCRPVSAILFHGFGMPPWYDLPMVQCRTHYRNRMTDLVNHTARAVFAAGFNQVDVHEAFPVNLMRLDAGLRVLRGVDRFLFERQYAGFVMLTPPFLKLKPQPRLTLIRSIRWNSRLAGELDLLTA